MENLIYKCKKSKEVSRITANLSSEQKNIILNNAANSLIENIDNILKENQKDLELAKKSGIKLSLIDRLTLTEQRIKAMSLGLREVALLDDPIGEVLYMKTRPNGLMIGQKRVAIGVIGIIYEARPNVTADAFGLCIKAGSAVILRGGKEAINSNIAIIKSFQKSLLDVGFPIEIVQLIEDTSRETAKNMMKLNEYIDVLIPRGGSGLIQSVINNSTIPVIKTGVGNCHIFVDNSANQENAVDIIINAKAQRPGVCNAVETLIIHKDISKEFIPKVCEALSKVKVEIRGDDVVQKLYKPVIPATEEDWKTEYLDYIISIKVVNNIEEAMKHIQTYSTGHSEAIITENYTNSQKFLDEIDSAAVYVNASTRFTDGNEFGFGAEIGISTQKLHARGPMGLKELTTTKYIIYGNGQIKP